MSRSKTVTLAQGPAALSAVAQALRKGAVAAVPTDTVYGLVVEARQPAAAARLSRAKGRDETTATQVLVADLGQAEELVAPEALGGSVRRVLEEFWPGGLTVVLRRRAGLRLDLGGDPDSVGLRCPDHPWLQELCRQVGPLAATSANRHGEPPLISASEVLTVLGSAVAVVVDGGVGGQVASTVVDLRGTPRVLREGAVPASTLLALLDAAEEPST